MVQARGDELSSFSFARAGRALLSLGRRRGRGAQGEVVMKTRQEATSSGEIFNCTNF